MANRDYTELLATLSEEYTHRSPRSAELHQQALNYLIDGGNHALRLIQPFSPRITRAHGAWVEDEDGHQILDFWQGHYANVLGHNPSVVTEVLAQMFGEALGLQTGFTDRTQIDVAELICQQTGHERVRFTTSGTLATMYAIMLARTFTGRDRVLKVGGGWHGGHLWGLKGVGWRPSNGYDHVEGGGIPSTITDDVIITGFNDPDRLKADFEAYGDQLACFILEPVIGTGGLMPATLEYMKLARELTEQYGVLLILDEVIAGFRFRAGDAGQLFGIKADMTTMGKAIGGGMPVAAVAGRADILQLTSRTSHTPVKFSGGTYSSHPASIVAARALLTYLIENEGTIYSALAEIGADIRSAVTEAFAAEDIYVRFAGDRSSVIPNSSLHMLLFPYEQDLPLETPEEVRNPAVCDIQLSEIVLQLALLLENVHVVHGLGSSTAVNTPEDVDYLAEACRRVAKRIKPYL